MTGEPYLLEHMRDAICYEFSFKFASTWFCLMPWAIGSILDGLAGDYWSTPAI
jgi:hypothetical protein